MKLRRFFQSIALFAFLSLHANAAIFLVLNTNDTTSITSLRGAVIAANRLGGNNTILLGDVMNFGGHSHPMTYRLTIPGTDEGAALTGDLNITHGRMTIKGFTPCVTIDATGLGDRVFNISSNAQLTLENLMITGGTAPGGNSFLVNGEFGGAIYNGGTLILENCVITNNISGGGQYVQGNGGGTGGGDGGGIYNQGTLEAANCAIVGNSAGAGFDDGFGGNGGAIRNDGSTRLSNCIISGNQSGGGGGPEGNAAGGGGYGGNGGAIFNSGTLILDQCIIGANAAGSGASGGDPSGLVGIGWPGGWGGNGGSGGGIYNLGELEIDFSTLYGNSAGNGGNGGSFGAGGNGGTGGSGGGIFNAGEIDLNTSTISSNSCGTGGNGGSGGIYGGAAGSAGGSGGGICNSDGSLTLTSSTITLNACGVGGNGGNGRTFDQISGASGGNGGDGGGIANNSDTATVFVRNSLIAQNLANVGGAAGTNMGGIEIYGSPPPPPQIGNPGANGTGFDVSGNFTSQGFNLISMGDGGIGFTNSINADQVGNDNSPIDPLLGPLQNNGGFTPTHALLWGSPAIDQGNCFGIHRDQRGDRRPYIYRSIPKPSGGDGSDIGAFELDTSQ